MGEALIAPPVRGHMGALAPVVTFKKQTNHETSQFRQVTFMSSYTRQLLQFPTHQFAPERHISTEAAVLLMTARAQRTGEQPRCVSTYTPRCCFPPRHQSPRQPLQLQALSSQTMSLHEIPNIGFYLKKNKKTHSPLYATDLLKVPVQKGPWLFVCL